MLQRLAAVIAALLLLYPSAPAGADNVPVCVGQDIKPLTKHGQAAGDQLVKYEVGECGGGMGPTGETVAKWACFKQFWMSEDNLYLFVYEKDPKVAGNWVLNSVVTVRDGVAIDVPVPLCEGLDNFDGPSPVPLPGEGKVFPGDPLNRRL